MAEQRVERTKIQNVVKVVLKADSGSADAPLISHACF